MVEIKKLPAVFYSTAAGFIKKTPKTPKPDLDLALKRKKEVQS